MRRPCCGRRGRWPRSKQDQPGGFRNQAIELFEVKRLAVRDAFLEQRIDAAALAQAHDDYVAAFAELDGAAAACHARQ